MYTQFSIYRQAAAILLTIFIISYVMTSCNVYKCPNDGFSGYTSAHFKAVKGPKRTSF
jgi:hypothetical protein